MARRMVEVPGYATPQLFTVCFSFAFCRTHRSPPLSTASPCCRGAVDGGVRRRDLASCLRQRAPCAVQEVRSASSLRLAACSDNPATLRATGRAAFGVSRFGPRTWFPITRSRSMWSHALLTWCAGAVPQRPLSYAEEAHPSTQCRRMVRSRRRSITASIVAGWVHACNKAQFVSDRSTQAVCWCGVRRHHR